MGWLAAAAAAAAAARQRGNEIQQGWRDARGPEGQNEPHTLQLSAKCVYVCVCVCVCVTHGGSAPHCAGNR